MTVETRGNEQTLELLQQRNICRWRSPFQSQHGGMIGASTGSYVYPRICGSFFSCTALVSLRPMPSLRFSALSRFRAPNYLWQKKSPVAFSQKKVSNVHLLRSLPLPSYVRSQALVRKEGKAFFSLTQIRDSRPVVIAVSRTNLWIPNIAGATQTCRHWNSRSDSKIATGGDWCWISITRFCNLGRAIFFESHPIRTIGERWLTCMATDFILRRTSPMKSLSRGAFRDFNSSRMYRVSIHRSLNHNVYHSYFFVFNSFLMWKKSPISEFRSHESLDRE